MLMYFANRALSLIAILYIAVIKIDGSAMVEIDGSTTVEIGGSAMIEIGRCPKIKSGGLCQYQGRWLPRIRTHGTRHSVSMALTARIQSMIEDTLVHWASVI